MKQYIIIILTAMLIASCQEKKQTEIRWVHSKTIALADVNPIGIAQGEKGIWLSDGDRNRLVLIDNSGVVLNTIDSLDRPMHIASEGEMLVIPQYGNDEILRFRESEKEIVRTWDSLDAPAGVAIKGAEIAIADFYNNKVHYTENSNDWITFGKEGKADGDFYYPTDVHLTESNIWVADAYNNRLQVFDKKGNHLKTIGEDQKMNAATGIFVSDTNAYTTDFENDRVLVFDLEGSLKQVLDTDISKPTDLIIIDEVLYVTNYKGKSLSLYTQQEVEISSQEGHDTHNDHHDHEDHKD
ncbi:NHL repeat-containing protein [Dokdonia sp. MED134]|uniref:NHL repeat-containing protein n=1 Tax=Dokdonia sp. MED134 TaxID=313590 RepID=UPI0000689FBC|nr:NHL repeat-containing protein [Dokdonia sp. MED134]